MNIRGFFNLVRMDIKDVDAAKYSDYDISMAYNQVMSDAYNTLSTTTGDVLTQSKDLPVINGSATLPDDFLSIMRVVGNGSDLSPSRDAMNSNRTGCYYIVGQNMFSNHDAVSILYTSTFSPITPADLDKDFPLPGYFIVTMKKYIVYCLLNQDTSKLSTDVYKVAANAGLCNLEAAPAFRV